MHSSTAAVIWEIWIRKRPLMWLVIGITVFGCLFAGLMPDTNSKAAAVLVELITDILILSALLIVFAICSYSEPSPQKGLIGFPHRLFVLPVSSFRLVAVPMVVSVAVTGVGYLVWAAFVFDPERRSPWAGLLLVVYVVLYQTVLWTLPGLRSLRVLVLGLIAVLLIMMPIFPGIRGLSETAKIALMFGLGLIGFLTSWIHVSLQRSGGTNLRILEGVARLARLKVQRLPRRGRTFKSAEAAQFWYEWRRSGSVLPFTVAALLAIVIVPLSWSLRESGSDSLRILAATVAMPMILALATGKAFSRPDFWSTDLFLPSFIAVRPLATVDLVAIKMKVAAVSAAVSWLLVVAFLVLWLPLWANLDSIGMARGVLWQLSGHSVYPQYAIAGLGIIAGMLLTWTFLVDGLWLGLSGSNRVFALSAIPYVLVPLFGIPGIFVAVQFHQSVLDWIHDKVGPLTPILMWLAAVAVIAKFWIAAVSWRRIPVQHVRRYLPIWAGGTGCLVAFALLLWDTLAPLLASDTYQLRDLLIFIAMLVIPLARIGLAPTFLSRNRHR